MSERKRLGGVIHTYQKFDPRHFPSPTQPPPDLVSPAFEHMLMYGSMRELTDEELARAIHLDPSQIAGLGPSLEAIRQMLLERKRKILETYETNKVEKAARDAYQKQGDSIKPPKNLAKRFEQSFRDEQLRELERLWYQAGDDRSRFARELMQLVAALGDKYQIDELAAEVHVHRPHADDDSQGAGSQGRAGDDRPAAQAVGGSRQERADRRDRSRPAGRVCRAGRHRKARTACKSRSKS